MKLQTLQRIQAPERKPGRTVQQENTKSKGGHEDV